MKRLIMLIVLVLLAGTASAEFSKVGSAGAQFLKIAVGSRYQAMGEASVAIVDDAYASYWNPAGLSEIENTTVSFTTVDWLLDIDLNYVSLARYFDEVGVFGVSASVLSMDDQEITTFEEQEGSGEFYSASSYAVGLSYARQLTNRFSFGLTAKYIEERIHNEKASGFAFDFGTLLYTGFRSLRLAMSISNMGPEMRFSGPDLAVNYDGLDGTGSNDAVPAELKSTPYDLPMLFRLGMAYDVEMGQTTMLTVAGELKHPNDNLQQGSFGAELGFSDRFFLRSGYKINYEEEGLTLGGGLSANISHSTKLLVDYSWQDFGRLESAQRFSVGFTF